MQTILNFLKHEHPASFNLNELCYEMGYTLYDTLTMVEQYYLSGDIQIDGFRVSAKNPLTKEESINYEEAETEYIEVIDE